MTMEENPLPSSELLSSFIRESNDGYAVYSSDDRMIYCNSAFADYYRTPLEDLLGVTFDELIRLCHQRRIGTKIDNPDIESFLAYARTVRRYRPFRHFEVDMYDGRWFLISEQLNEANELMVQMKDITKQKLSLQQLEHSVESLHELAQTDELTHVANRRGFIHTVESELDRCHRHEAPVSLALLDLDLFKPINDRFGHQVGDQVLIHIADQVKSHLRPYDTLGRIGGDEFAIFLGETQNESARDVCERIRLAVEDSPFMVEDEQIDLGISFGVTTRHDTPGFEQLYREADIALYQAKSRGRNCVAQFVRPEGLG